MDNLSSTRAFNGWQFVFKHHSEVTNCEMTFSVYMPDIAKREARPCLFYLSGLTCTHDNVTTKGGFQRMASELGLIIVCPDTSPRGDDVANDDNYDLGQGAGFYVNATQEPWAPHFQMYDYIVKELPTLVAEEFDVTDFGIFGHSMGGHGALTIGLRNPDLFKSISAFSPIVSPTNCPWGVKALTAYLGDDRDAWAQHDACALLLTNGAVKADILIDQGDADNFLDDQLKTELFAKAAAKVGQSAEIRMQEDFDHSYYFIASFMDDHLRHHAKALLS